LFEVVEVANFLVGVVGNPRFQIRVMGAFHLPSEECFFVAAWNLEYSLQTTIIEPL
jgi:hypothetical protein